jgi:hypothetical protein
MSGIFTQLEVETLTAILADALADPYAPIDREAAMGALDQFGKAGQPSSISISPDLTPPELAAAALCWEVLGEDWPGISRVQYYRTLRKLTAEHSERALRSQRIISAVSSLDGSGISSAAL